MSLVESRRNSSPHLVATIPMQSSPVWRKSSHPPFKPQHPSFNSPPPPFNSARDHHRIQQSLFILPSQPKPKPPPPPPAPPESPPPSSRNGESSDGEGAVSPGVYHRMLYHSEDLKTLIQTIISEVKSIIKAETCSLFLVDRENRELVAKVFDKADDLSEIRLPLDKGVVGRVAVTQSLMNVRDVKRCPFFYQNVDQMTGFQTRNILCFPIVDNAGTFVGVVELCNREGKCSFSRHDEYKARTFAVYCATSLSHCLLYRKVQEAQRRTHMAAEWLVNDCPLTMNPDDVERLSRMQIPSWQRWHRDFDRFSFAPRSIGGAYEYAAAAMTMFEDLGFVKLYRIRQDTLAQFILRVANGYREVPYHNWSHAFAVAHFCWLALRTSAVRHGLEEMERLALLIACLCHDIDHRGTTNKFQLQTHTPLAQLYSSEGSVLERHHYAQTVTILRDSKCNILEQLTRTQYQQVMNHVRDVILATDIAVHIGKVSRIKEMVEVGFNPLSHDHHYLFMCLIMTASDLSDQSKDFRNSKAIAENIYLEFFSQGDLEKQMGTEPMPMMDRDKAKVPQIQLDFMDTVALPVFDMMSKLVPDGISTFEAISFNRKCWQALDDIMDKSGKPVSGLQYLRDEELEREVMERVAIEGRETTRKDASLNNHTDQLR